MRRSGDLCTNLQSTLWGCKLGKGVCHSWEWHSLSLFTREWMHSTVLTGVKMCFTAGTQPVGSCSQARYLVGRDITTITHTKVNYNKAIQYFHFYIHHSWNQSLQIPRDWLVDFTRFESETQSWLVQSGTSACTISGHRRVLIHEWKFLKIMHLSYILINSYGAFHVLAF